MRSILFIGGIAVIGLLTSDEAFPQSGAYGVPFLLMTPDARGLALGDGGSVYATGATAAYYNPAGLAGSALVSGEFGIREVLPELTDDIRSKNIYLSTNYGGWGYFGVSYGRLGLGERSPMDGYYDAPGTYEPRDLILGLTVAVTMDSNTSVGAAVKYISSKMSFGWGADLESGSSAALDLGIITRNHFPRLTLRRDKQYYPILRNYCRTRDDRGLAAGISISNWGPDISYSNTNVEEPLPTRLRLAMGYQAIDTDHLGLRLTVDGSKLLLDTNDGFDVEWQEIVWSYGLEGAFLYVIHLRLGRYVDRAGHQKFWTTGFGLGPEWLRLDYAKVLESDEDWNRRAGESEISVYFNIEPGIFGRGRGN